MVRSTQQFDDRHFDSPAFIHWESLANLKASCQKTVDYANCEEKSRHFAINQGLLSRVADTIKRDSPDRRQEEADMRSITNILFPVDFSPSCIAMATYVKRAAAFYDANVSLVHVFDPASYNGFELYVRRSREIAEDHREIARSRLNSFLEDEFPTWQYARILVAGEAGAQIAQVARNGFDLIIMPTHAGTFRRMLLGSTTAKVLNDADCPVVTSRHAQTIAPRPLEHREWLCAIGLSEDSERVLRFIHQAAGEGHANLRIIHAIQATSPNLPIHRNEARQRIADLQQTVGSQAPVQIVVGPIKEALLDAVQRFDADALAIGRSPQSGALGRIRDLTYVLVRDSPYPVMSI
jgi:nucleotide-binding universal stress UspA family protein